jgi:hypothetical protein
MADIAEGVVRSKVALTDPLHNIGLALGGLAALRMVAPHVTGRERLYHGTTEELAQKIRAEGLRPRSEVGGAGITEILEKDVRELGKSLAYATPDKTDARSYQEQARAIRDHGGNIPKALQAIEDDAHFDDRSLNVLNNKGIVSMNVPLWKLRQEGRITKNPELGNGTRAEWRDHLYDRLRTEAPEAAALIDKHRVIKPLMNIWLNHQHRGLNKAVVVKGGIEKDYIRGSDSYKGITANEIRDYAKANPHRFGAGSALGAAGIGALGYGAHGLIKALVKGAELSIEESSMSTSEKLAAARQLLKIAASGESLGVPLGKLLAHGYGASKYVVGKSGEVAKGVTKGLGGSETAQEAASLAGKGTALYGGYAGGKKTKRKVDEWRYQNGLY